MRKKLSCAMTALIVALLVGGDLFGVVGAVGWVLARKLGLAEHALEAAALAAALPSLAVVWWVAGTVYAVAMKDPDADPVV